MFTTAVILVNWNGKDVTLDCIQSLRESQDGTFDILLVDNASTDDSIEAITRRYPEIVIIQNSENLGFTGGNNVGIGYALDRSYEFIMLLNNDTFVEKKAVSTLREYLISRPEISAVQPKINFHHDRSMIWNAGGKVNKYTGLVQIRGYGNHLSKGRDDFTPGWLTGCCIMSRAEAWRTVGLLNSEYFAYYEDLEWSLRLRRSNLKLDYYPETLVYHIAGATSEESEKQAEGFIRPIIHYYSFRNYVRTLRIHRDFFFGPSVWAIMCMKFLAFFIYFLLRGRFQKLRMLVNGLKDGLKPL